MAREEQTMGPGLALSGGGFRATLFNLGAVWRLNDAGWLKKLAIVTSVSGGSITSGVLAFKWGKLKFDGAGVAANFRDEVAAPVQHFCTLSIDVTAGIEGLVNVFDTIPKRIAAKYRAELFGDATLQDLPDPATEPRFVFYATSLQSGASVRMSRKYLGGLSRRQNSQPDAAARDRRGRVQRFSAGDVARRRRPRPGALAGPGGCRSLFTGRVPEATAAVGRWRLRQHGSRIDLGPLQDRARQRRGCAVLAGSGTRSGVAEPGGTRARHRVRADAPAAPLVARRRFHREAAARRLLGHRDEDRAYNVDALAKDTADTAALQHIRTRLNPFTAKEQAQLVNWGYALSDAAMSSNVDTKLPKGTLPYPDTPL